MSFAWIGVLVFVLSWPPQTPQTAAPTAASLPRLGQPAPAFAFSEIISPGLRSVQLRDLTPDSLRGQVVVLDFFATWCGPCLESIPHTNRLLETMADLPVVFLAVANEERTVLERMLKTTPMKATLVRDADGLTYRNYAIAGLPFVAILDRAGRIAAFTHPGRLTRGQLEEIARRQ